MNIDDTDTTGFNEINFYGAGGIGSENRLNFFNTADRIGGANTIIKTTNLGSGLSRFGIMTAPTDDTTTPIENLTIDSDGNLGIKNTNPTFDIDISGDINYTGNIYENGTLKVFGTKLNPTDIGHIPFGDGTDILLSNAVFFWDNTNNRLGIN